jgi:hypothetical protein
MGPLSSSKSRDHVVDGYIIVDIYVDGHREEDISISSL